MRGDGDEPLTACAGDGHLGRRSVLRETIPSRCGRHRGNARTISRNLRREQIGVLARGEADDLQPIGMRVDDRERALSDRAGGSEDGDAFHHGAGARG